MYAMHMFAALVAGLKQHHAAHISRLNWNLWGELLIMHTALPTCITAYADQADSRARRALLLR